MPANAVKAMVTPPFAAASFQNPPSPTPTNTALLSWLMLLPMTSTAAAAPASMGWVSEMTNLPLGNRNTPSGFSTINQLITPAALMLLSLFLFSTLFSFSHFIAKQFIGISLCLFSRSVIYLSTDFLSLNLERGSERMKTWETSLRRYLYRNFLGEHLPFSAATKLLRRVRVLARVRSRSKTTSCGCVFYQWVQI